MRKKTKILLAGLIGILFVAVILLQRQNEKKIVLEFGMFAESNWGVANPNAYKIIDKAIEKFEEEHPNVEIHYEGGIKKDDYSEWLAQKTLSGEMPDVFMVLSEDFYQYASLGVLQGLDNQIANDRRFRMSYFYDSALEMGQYQEGQYALPYEVVPTLMFVNKTLLENEWIEVPEANWTWDDLKAISMAVSKDTDGDGMNDQFGICNYTWKEAVYSNGVSPFDNEGGKAYFSDGRVMDAVRFANNLKDLNGDIEVGMDEFEAGNVAFMPLAFSDYRTYKTYPYKIQKFTNFQWECITMPAGPKGENTSELDVLQMGMSKNSNHQELAWEFMKLLTADSEIQRMIFEYSHGASPLEYVTCSSYVESVIRADMDVSEKVIDYQLLSDVVENGEIHPRFTGYEEVMTLAESRIDQIYKEEKNIDSSLKILQREATKYLKQ
ncbi:sugar ABC transporter substrate-binding protein [Lachnospiraceae bacterium OttesenSCG-928-E19]|nr:sugar ABC transporter substrate-binding protein [Lachnospiraceae bacterium OttesenSCG-928-E19]